VLAYSLPNKTGTGEKVTLTSNGRRKDRVSPRIIREARMRQLDEKWLSSSSTALLGRYRGKYVAVGEKKILAASSTMKGLYRKLDELNPGMVLITKVEKPTLRARNFRNLSGFIRPEGNLLRAS